MFDLSIVLQNVKRNIEEKNVRIANQLMIEENILHL